MQPYVVLRVHLSKNLSENTCYGLLLRSWQGLMRVRAEWTTTLIWFTLWSSGLETFLKSQSKIRIWIYQNGRFSWSTTCFKKSRRLMIYCLDSLPVHLHRLHVIKVIWTPVYLYARGESGVSLKGLILIVDLITLWKIIIWQQSTQVIFYLFFTFTCSHVHDSHANLISN